MIFFFFYESKYTKNYYGVKIYIIHLNISQCLTCILLINEIKIFSKLVELSNKLLFLTIEVFLEIVKEIFMEDRYCEVFFALDYPIGSDASSQRFILS